MSTMPKNAKHLLMMLARSSEELHLKLNAALVILEALDPPGWRGLYAQAVSDEVVKRQLHEQFLSLYAEIERAVQDQEFEDAVQKLLRMPTKGPIV